MEKKEKKENFSLRRPRHEKGEKGEKPFRVFSFSPCLSPSPSPPDASTVRTAIEKADPALLTLLDTARDRLGARLTYLDTPTLKAGRRPADFDSNENYSQ